MTTIEDQQLNIVRKLYEFTGTANWSAAAELLTDDFFITEAPTMPFAGFYTGRNALKELYLKVMVMIDVTDLSVIETTVHGDYAVTLLDMVLAGESAVRVPIAEMFRFRDGLVCEIRPYYFDPTPIVAAANAKKQLTGLPHRTDAAPVRADC